MDFRILGLDPTPFRPLFKLSDSVLQEFGALRVLVDAPRSAPDRIGLDDAAPGETVLLLNHLYLDVATPYRGTHAIYVREGDGERFDRVNDVPPALRRRMLSLRAFAADGMMLDADLVDGDRIETLIERLFSNPQVDFIQTHFAKRGCYAARIERA